MMMISSFYKLSYGPENMLAEFLLFGEETDDEC